MNQYDLTGDFVIQRSARDRRKAKNAPPPYLTTDGFVLIDRREYGERREEQQNSANDNGKPGLREMPLELVAA